MTAVRLDRVDARPTGSLLEQSDGLPVQVVRPFVHGAQSDTEVDNDRRSTSPLPDDPSSEQDQQHIIIDDLMRIRIGTPFHVEQFDGDSFEYRSEDSDND